MKPKLLLYLLIFAFTACHQVDPPQPYGALPSAAQMAWHEMEYFSLVCYGLNTYTEEEWAYGDVDPGLFNPSDLNTDQWAQTASEAEMKGLILVAKHHDGFCLWPSQYTDYSVKATPWKNGAGDVLGDLAKSCKKYGLKLGVYLSPWDRNHAEYGRPEYVNYYYRQLEELLTSYGDIFEFWIDGANGGTGYYGGANERRNIDAKNYYGYDSIFSIVEKYQPNAVIFSDIGPGTRWVGNEDGIGGETNWNTISPGDKVPGVSDSEYVKKLSTGEEGGAKWIPAEVNTTLLWPKAWYYHTGQPVRSLGNLMDLYYTSVGRGSPLNLGLAIAPSGLIREADRRALLKFGEQVKREFESNLLEQARIKADNVRNSKFDTGLIADKNNETYWATSDGVNSATLEFDFGKPTVFNRLLLQEYIALGQRVDSFSLEIEKDGKFVEIAHGTTIGYKRLLRFDEVSTQKARLKLSTKAPCLTLSNAGIYHAPALVPDPLPEVDLQGNLSFASPDGISIYYALGEDPDSADFKKYTTPLAIPEGGKLHCFAQDDKTGFRTEGIMHEFGVARKNWKVISVDGQNSKESQLAIDNDSKSFLTGSEQKSEHPHEIVIDMARPTNISAFSYLARQDGEKEGIIYEYEFLCSADGSNWKLMASGTFSNIENNPNRRIVRFDEKVTARYLKMRSLSDVRQSGKASWAEVEVFAD
ncbi:alpha-L-fucosidase [Maribellus sediminis]|uniref:alpha-L-fucosidase n=1 Tax=Maribellus sediminis TaxID=2696285 RepID=UPI00143130A3|nr:alpha-L-fucosidase [Maribellus sediminis]